MAYPMSDHPVLVIIWHTDM